MMQLCISKDLYEDWRAGHPMARETARRILRKKHFNYARSLLCPNGVMIGNPELAFDETYKIIDKRVTTDDNKKKIIWKGSQQFHALFHTILHRQCIREAMTTVIGLRPAQSVKESQDIRDPISDSHLLIFDKDSVIELVRAWAIVSEKLKQKQRKQRGHIVDCVIIVIKKELLASNNQLVSELNEILTQALDLHQVPESFPDLVVKFFNLQRLKRIMQEASKRVKSAESLRELVDLTWHDALEYEKLRNTSLKAIFQTYEKNDGISVTLNKKELWHSARKLLGWNRNHFEKNKSRLFADLRELWEQNELPAILYAFVEELIINDVLTLIADCEKCLKNLTEVPAALLEALVLYFKWLLIREQARYDAVNCYDIKLEDVKLYQRKELLRCCRKLDAWSPSYAGFIRFSQHYRLVSNNLKGEQITQFFDRLRTIKPQPKRLIKNLRDIFNKKG